MYIGNEFNCNVKSLKISIQRIKFRKNWSNQKAIKLFVLDNSKPGFIFCQKQLFECTLFDEMNSSIDDLSTFGLSYFSEWIKSKMSIEFCYSNFPETNSKVLSIQKIMEDDLVLKISQGKCEEKDGEIERKMKNMFI